ncbi:MAG: DNA-directed RNA polymerase subunit beta' [Candidatus Vogelbacteria bacterium]|nr:DNA-directed RNA polymerase subunit beta' [Candidatus Vogelbacteria bacterium]
MAEPTDFNAISLKLASPDDIRGWSHGEVTKAETINYRTGRSERGGLFDERIFGPEKDYECYCGKYRRIRYRDIICERCGVEVTRSIVRRERLGHIELASPVAHIWFLRSVPSRIGLILDVSINDLEKVIYFAGYIITQVNETERARILKEIDSEYKTKVKGLQDERSREKLKETLLEVKRQLSRLASGQVLDEVAYHRLSLKYGSVFEAGIGAEAVWQIFKNLDLEAAIKELTGQLKQASAAERLRLQRRYNLLTSMKKAGLRPEWMFLTAIPVIPPDLRPIVPLDGGRHATSDVNDLYRRVINRNNRLKKLKELNAPEVILRNEKRILQEAVDALIDNSIRRGQSANLMNQSQRRALKSLSDSLKGKQGRFRQNLLGKRVDYSGRSVIVIGPELKLSECGLPKHMALELFRPFVISKILQTELAFNIRGANRLIDDQIPEVWEILEQVIEDKYVLLNRAPTLHRLGIQAFRPILIEGDAIRIHPLVCAAFNADFDGDQMAVYVPLSAAAQKEAREIMAANRNILKPGNGQPVISLKLDIVLGCYWVTRFLPNDVGAGKIFADCEEAITAYQFAAVSLRAPIKILNTGDGKWRGLADRLIETSVGRILFNKTLPSDFPFLNFEMTAKEMTRLIDDLIVRYGIGQIAEIVDRIKNFGFVYATYSGITWGLDDVLVPVGKDALIKEAKIESAKLVETYNEGLLSKDEKYRLDIEIWSRVRSRVEKLLPTTLDKNGPVMHMLNSGARGSISQVAQMSAMKGLITSPAGPLIDFPIIPSYKEGLSPLEYFITTHGSRKTLTDTALNTAKAGYLTQRLVNVAQEVIVTEPDCGEKHGKKLTRANISSLDAGLANVIRGRVLAADIQLAGGETLFKKGRLLSNVEARQVEAAGVTEAVIRSILTCQSVRGVCQRCYGADPGRGTLVEIGEAVGIVAAQAIGEPGTQLTMRTKHSGGVDVGGDIVGGLPRVEEIFERRLPRHPAAVSVAAAVVAEVRQSDKENVIMVLPDDRGKKAASQTPIEYKFSLFRTALVKGGDRVVAGQLLTDGPADLMELFRYAGKDATEEYIIGEINNIYELQGASITRKHLEVIIRQMFSRRRVKEIGGTPFEVGEIVEQSDLAEANQDALKRGLDRATAETMLLGISEVSLTASSFLAAVSFQQSTKMLIKTALRGGLDRLRGLKENVIVGRLIPAGTGLKSDYAPAAAPTEHVLDPRTG